MGGGLVGEAADDIYAKIQAFANFGFAESHSLSFGLLVYASSWLKLHYPAAFLAALIEHFGDEPFERGNLDAGRLSWLLGREVVAVGKLDPTSYEQLLKVDLKKAEASFPELFAVESPPDFGWDDDDWDDDDDAGDEDDA